MLLKYREVLLYPVSIKMSLDMDDEVITLGDSSDEDEEVEIVEEKRLSPDLGANSKLAKEQLEDIVKKRLEEVLFSFYLFF